MRLLLAGKLEPVRVPNTACGMASFSGDEFQAELGPETPGIEFDTFDSPEQARANDAARLRRHPLIQPGTGGARSAQDVSGRRARVGGDCGLPGY